MKKIFDFIKKPVITEKTTKLIEQKQYTFDVDAKLTKTQIKKIFEQYYGIQIKSIRTHRIEKKNLKKRAILSCNQEISIFEKNAQPDIIKTFK